MGKGLDLPLSHSPDRRSRQNSEALLSECPRPEARP